MTGKRGRKSTFTQALADEICERLSAGETLVDICKSLGIGVQTVHDWRAAHPSFAVEFGRARDAGFDVIANDVLVILDTRPEIATTEGGARVDSGHVAWLKNRAEGRMKLLAKWDPRRYGERAAVELTGKDGGPVEIDDTSAAARVAALMAAAQARKEAQAGRDDDVDDLV